ncbi:MAG: hypothetical protein HY475_01695 [Candidatus Terrybacteria bacterium]|nr:hypothetical protein [Candidatus Terrybacteria bacterium]
MPPKHILLKTARSLRIHCVGVKGIGLSALAQFLAGQGAIVSGSDIPDPFPADRALRRAGVKILRGFSVSHLPRRCDAVIASNAYLPKEWGLRMGDRRKRRTSVGNPEVREAIRRRIPVISYPEAVAALFNAAPRGIAIAGSHGKSTTTALLAVTLEALGENPTAIVGAIVKNWNSNARVPKSRISHHAADAPRDPSEPRPMPTPFGGPLHSSGSRSAPLRSGGISSFQIPNSRFFVLEADEYRRAFLQYRPFGAVVTSVEWDHPDVYRSAAAYRAAFRAFAGHVLQGGFLVACGDEKDMATIHAGARPKRFIRYGFGPGNTLRIRGVRHTLQGLDIALSYRGKSIGRFPVQLFGRHHALNVAAAVAVCLCLGVSVSRIRRALARFRGTKRRFDVLAPGDRRANRPVVIDDYAHHPTEIAATIVAARSAFPRRRIRVLFQPHTFSRTAVFFTAFRRALRLADEVALLKTYGSARERRGGKSAKDLATALGARYFASHVAAMRYFRARLGGDDVFLTIGAGDGDRVARAVAKVRFSR